MAGLGWPGQLAWAASRLEGWVAWAQGRLAVLLPPCGRVADQLGGWQPFGQLAKSVAPFIQTAPPPGKVSRLCGFFCRPLPPPLSV